jgi:NADH-quinone oxidoreductase subunit N
MILATTHVATPTFDWNALAPFIALAAGMLGSLVVGLVPGRTSKVLAILVGVAGAATAGVFALGQWNEPTTSRVVADSLVIDRAALAGIIIASASAITGLAIAARGRGTDDAGHGETASLILASTLGMAILASANDLVTVFLGLELLSIPLYVLCASHVDRAASLESGLKYLILGSVGSATALMGIAFIYGATGEMQIDKIVGVAGQSDLQGLIVPGLALLVAGFGFKLSLAPLHQWTPDVYDGAPTAVTAFMSVATKSAALVVTARILIVALPNQYELWQPMLYVLAAASIIIGNVGALGQPSMKRLMGYSSIAQAGYLVAALSVGAVSAMLAYLATYAVATLAVFAAVAAREVERPDLGDDIAALDGIAKDRPLLAWFGTIGLFGLAGLPLTAGFFGKVAVVALLVQGGQTWLGVLLIVGSIISLAYYAPPVLRMWRGTPAPGPAPVVKPAEGMPVVVPTAANVPAAVPAGGGVALAEAPVAVAAPPAPKVAGTVESGGDVVLPGKAPWELGAIGLIMSVLVVAGGIYPNPLLHLAHEASNALFGLR